MKKIYKKLCAVAFALMGATSLSAQTDVTSTYIKNADFSSTDGWTVYKSGTFSDIGSGKIGEYKVRNDVGTAATVDATHLATESCFGFEIRWGGSYSSYRQESLQELPAGVYSLTFDVQNTNTNTTAGAYENLCYVQVGDAACIDKSNEWMNGGTSWTTHTITFAVPTAKKVTFSLGIGSGSTNIGHANTPTLYISHLKLSSISVDDISESNPADYTSYMTNPSFEKGDGTGWTYNTSSDTGVKANSNATYTTTGVHGSYLFNTWWRGVPLTQTVTNLPNGIYELKALVASGDGSGTTPDFFLLANGEHSNVYTISDGDKSKFHEMSYEFKVINGQATVGIVGGNDDGTYNADGHWWYKADHFRLTYKGADVSILLDAFNTNYAALTALSTVNIPSAFVDEIEALKNKYTTAPSSKADLNKANEEISAIINNYDAIAKSYLNMNALITLCKSHSTNSTPKTEGDRTTFDNAISAAESRNETFTSSDIVAYTEAYNTLESARQTYVTSGAKPTEGFPFDMTFFVVNPYFDVDVTGWSHNTGAPNYGKASNQGGAITGIFYETWKWESYIGSIYQNITGLPAGYYSLTAAAFRDQLADGKTDTDAVYLYGNEQTTLVNSATPTLYTVNEIKIDDAEGKLEIGLKSIVETYRWMGIDNIKLSYTAGLDVSELQATVATLKAEAETISGKMNAEIQTNLTAAIEGADPTSEIPTELDAMILALQNVIPAAKASVENYEKIPTYIAKANTIDESIAADYQKAYDDGTITADAETIFQELEVATYNYVTDEFSYPVKLSDNWNVEGPTGSLSAQHWSGETRPYLEQSSEAWGQNSWTIKYDQNLTLPAGEYVFKVAGRKAAGNGCTLSLTVTSGEETLGTVNDFPEGDRGLGINKNGETSFNAEDEAGFANDGAGRGWQWRYVKFALPSEATVNIAVNAEATIQHQWVSFCDATVQMTEETYLEANQAGLDAVLIPAQALVNTKPMGTAENTALSNAINMPVTTGAEMKAKIDALNTAVANANTWRTAYNEAKAPLVVQLDRFEANFNDAENGCISKLYTEIWKTCIEKVAAAAEAKDITDRYDQFEIITEELTAANDAVEASIAVYKNFKKEIDNAKAYQLIVKDNQTNYNAAITEAETIYNNGSEEFPSALAMQNFKVLDYNYVMETYEGVATLGDWDGNWTSQLESQHYDGLGNTGNKYYDNNANGDFANSQTFTLPAGTYVFSGIGRASNNGGATSYIKVNDTQVNFPQKGDTGYGVNTNGVADFTNEATYANNDNGRGWEYRFIEFTLAEKTEVTLSYGISCTGSWGSVFTPQLRAKKLIMTDKAKIENETEEGYFVSYDREFAAGTYTTVMVPFDYDLPDGVVAEELDFIAFNGPDNNWISFKEVETMTANTPYILKNNSATAALFADLGIKTVYSTASTDSVEVPGATMKGTYKAITATELVEQEDGDIIFVNTDGEGKYIDDEAPANITFPAGRAYIVVNKNTFSTSTGVAPKFTIFHGDDDLNSIEETVNVEVKDDVIYDLAGRRIVKPTKAGIYIVNGKKMIIK